MYESSYAKYDRVIALVATGTRLGDALKDEKMSPQTYYKIDGEKNGTPAAEPRKSPKKEYVDIALRAENETTNKPIYVVVCMPNQIKDVLASLQ